MFNYRDEKKKFIKEWEKLNAEYVAHGMIKEQIEELKEYDWEWFKSRRRYENRTQKIPSEILVDKTDYSTLLQKYRNLRVEFDESNFTDKFAWVETIENPDIVTAIKTLSYEDLNILTLLVAGQYSQVEIAKKMGIPYRTIKYRINKMRKILK